MNATLDNTLTLLLVTLVVLILVVFTLLIVLKYRKKREAHQLEKERMQFEWEQQLLRVKLEIQEFSFKSISQEIHDNIGQVLSLSKLHLNTINWKDMDAAMDNTMQARDLLTTAIQDLRDLSKTLHTDWITDIGWMKALELELRKLERAGLTVYWKADSHVTDLPGASQLLLFRMVQEALQNVLKHAQARTVSIGITHTNNRTLVQVADDGIGFDATQQTQGTGLRNLNERAKMLAASVRFLNNTPGTTLLIELPITPSSTWHE